MKTVIVMIRMLRLGNNGSEMPVQKGRRRRGDADDLVGRLAVEHEVQFSLRLTIVPVAEGFQFGAAEGFFGFFELVDFNADAWGLAFKVRVFRGV